MMRGSSGFSLTELLLVLVIAALLLGLGLPSYFTFIERSQVRTTTSELVSSLNAARIEAIRQGVSIRVCGDSSDDCSTDWSKGWLIKRSSQQVELARYSPGSRVTVSYRSQSPVVFTREGLLGHQTPVEIEVKGDNTNQARCISLAVAGYTKVSLEACQND